jgi:hypothetical protein
MGSTGDCYDMASTPLRMLLALALMGVIAAGCGTVRYDLRGGRDPGAGLHVVASMSRHERQTRLMFRAENLSPPDRIVDGGQVYLLWARRNSDTAWTRLGVLAYDPGSRQGTLEATYRDIRFEVVLTAERGEHPPGPSADVIFAQRVED